MTFNTQHLTSAALLIATLLATSAAVVATRDNQPQDLSEYLYEYRCFSDEDNVGAIQSFPQSAVGLQVTNRPIHQLLTRIFAIFSREFLKFRNIHLIPINLNINMASKHYEYDKIQNTLHYIQQFPSIPMINLEVWMLPNAHGPVSDTVKSAGATMSPGRFGWFVPTTLISDTPDDVLLGLHYSVFLNQSNPYYGQYLLDDRDLEYLSAGEGVEKYQNPHCVQRQCVTLLAEFREDTAFVVAQIEESGSYLNVLWLGTEFRKKIKELHQRYQNTIPKATKKRFIVLHWTQSDIIDADIKFKPITMPRCEDLESTACKYELTPVLKYFANKFNKSTDETIMLYALQRFNLDDGKFQDLQQMLVEASKNSDLSEDLYNRVACNWLQHYRHQADRWVYKKEPTISLIIGGIFPLAGSSRVHKNLTQAVLQAQDAINRDESLLRGYEVRVFLNNGMCKADHVMKAFLHYYNMERVLGVLGPACSDTVEPIAGISQHTNMAVISYSAEGASFVDRKTYPYFFRTIGSNRQYEDVYVSLMKHFGWRRVAALTEDGQKYTEYLSHMETSLKQHNMELIINKKFVSEVTSAEMNKYLLDLKQKHAKIIIADVYTKNAEKVFCEAYKLGMTAYEGYVWFLPDWLSKDWSSTNSSSNDTCTEDQLRTVTEGHFSLRHRPFGNENATMQENMTIREWLHHFNGTISNYTGFAYDAVWAYALAANKLLRENKEALDNIRTINVTKRLADLIWETDFEGLSGRVRFGLGGSRITDINIMQWHGSAFHEVGLFQPNIIGEKANMRPEGGTLTLRDAAFKWLATGGRPGDGTYDCSFSALAAFMDTDCESASVVFTAILCLTFVVVISLVSFLFWKQRYNKKIKRSAKIMKSFGIDLLTPSRSQFNTLDKWEIPRENVVVNRRLGEGAFGTVYGGEAKIGSGGWTAVAVKTLKAGASQEDRIDFLAEAEAMKRLDNKNVVKLIGVCLQSEPIYTIMEFMLYGDLKTYLLARRHMVNDRITDESDISSKRLTQYAMDVAKGLAYLAEQKYVHRDIACRNCLVDAQRVVKLGDFGMARPIGESDYYRFNRKGMLPVRWMAPESLADGLFTPASDVWAFGVVLFEIITFGSFPFQGMSNNQVLDYVKEGNCLQIPNGVKPQLEALLKTCWSYDIEKRLTAADIIDYISKEPRLLSPCLDIPGASVEMPETESDQLELLPTKKIRKSSPITKLDILPQHASSFDKPHEDFELKIEGNHIATPNHITIQEELLPITPDGYSVMQPLLPRQTISESSDSSQQPLIRQSPTELRVQTQC